jgi:hypothetical protein
LLQLLIPHPGRKHEREKNPDWQRGIANGAKIIRWIYDAPDIERDPDVQSARQSAQILLHAEAHSPTNEKWTDNIRPPTREEVAKELYRELFFDVVDQRFKGSRN